MVQKSPLQVLNLIAQTIFDKKGFNILALDVKELSTLTNFFIIAEGNVDKHVVAIAKSIIEELKQVGYRALHIEGLKTGDWIALDFDEVVVHLFMPGMRDHYQLEDLWKEGKIVDLEMSVSPN